MLMPASEPVMRMQFGIDAQVMLRFLDYLYNVFYETFVQIYSSQRIYKYHI